MSPMTMPRLARRCACLPSQLLCTTSKLAGLVLISALSLTSATLADESIAGEGTVAEWRARLGGYQMAAASYAAGVMATGNVFTRCKNPRTVRELHTYLVYRAPSTLTMKQAIWNFLIEADCTMPSEDRFLSSHSPQWKNKPTIYGEED
jgi:hypothetical protein